VIFAALASAAPLAPEAATAQTFTSIPQPIQVPLHWTPISWAGSGPAPSKLGIYVALGGSTTPQLFEFDTGGSGFYPTHDPKHSNTNSPWWGSDWSPTGYSFNQNYDSGNITYTGNLVSTSVGLFAGPGPGLPLLTAVGVNVGQTDRINNLTLEQLSSPPLEAAFWGDFGMALKQGKPGIDGTGGLPGPAPTIDSLIAQLQYGTGVTAGYRVHASAQNPWVQFGLGPQDLNLAAPAVTIQLNAGIGNSPAQIPYYAEYVVTGTLSVSDGITTFTDAATGLIFDTGAYTTIHNDGSTFPDALTSGGSVISGAAVQISAPSLQPSGPGVSTSFLDFSAGDTVNADLVWVKNGGPYYVNTGLLPFLSYDIIYQLGSDATEGRLTLVPQPAPEPLTASGLAVAAAVGGRLRRLRRRILERERRR